MLTQSTTLRVIAFTHFVFVYANWQKRKVYCNISNGFEFEKFSLKFKKKFAMMHH